MCIFEIIGAGGAIIGVRPVGEAAVKAAGVVARPDADGPARVIGNTGRIPARRNSNCKTPGRSD